MAETSQSIRPILPNIDHVELIKWSELRAGSRDNWESIREGRHEYRTPFFSTAFCHAVHSARGDVSVAVLRSGDREVGYLPFHQIGRVAVPAGRYFNDAHNVIIQPEAKLDWLWMLQQCNLKSYDFHALVPLQRPEEQPPEEQPPEEQGPEEQGPEQQGPEQQRPGGENQIDRMNAAMNQFAQGTTESFSAEIGTDSAAFLRQLEKDHKTIRKQEQKTRKLAREVGPVTLEFDCRDTDLLRQTILWKRQQYRRTNILDLFTPEWTRSLVENLHSGSGPETRGILSVLRAGDEVVAAHYGMIENDLLHYWFPTYNVEYSRYSPGTALFKEIVRTASEQKVTCIDMGYGEQPYKRKQTDTITTVSYGCVSKSRMYRQWKRATKAARGALKNVPMKEQLKQVLRLIQPNAGISKLN